MLFAKIKDFKLRQKYLSLEYKRLARKFALINIARHFPLFSNKRRCFLLKAYHLKAQSHTTRANKNQMIRRCLLTNRTKNVLHPYNFSRSIFRELLQFGLIPGAKKAVW